MMLPWSDIPVFLAIARGGTLSAAAGTLKLDRTTVSRRIESMERHLGAPLFDRGDRGFVLTKFGWQVFAASESAEQELSVIGQSQKHESHPGGHLRVSMSEHLLITLAECFTDFALQHPDILLELTATDRSVDLHHFEADVVLRISRESHQKLEVRNIGTPKFSLYCKKGDKAAASRYISRPSEQTMPKFVQKYVPSATIVAAVDGLVSMREMIAVGAGLGVLPNCFGDSDPRLKRCFDPVSSAGFQLCIAFRPEQRRLRRLKVFVDYVEGYLRDLGGFD